jgi:hypothetical protein
MKKFHEAHYDQVQLTAHATELLRMWEAGDEEIRQAFPALNATAAAELIMQHIAEIDSDTVYKNDVYQVAVRHPYPGLVHLSVKRIDRQCIHDWRDLQEIKNQIVGEECEGIELYPAESRRIDTANQYHLWCATDPAYRFSVGWNQGRLVTDKAVAGSFNRPLKPNDKQKGST